MMTDLQKATIAAIVNVFESGKPRGDYGAIAVLKGDKGHLSYGRSQVTLGSGTLYGLLSLYCDQPGAAFVAALRPQLERFRTRDVSLDVDTAVKQLLQRAGREDPVMRASQDQYFNDNYLSPACRHAEQFGVTKALGQAVVYDSHVQGGWDKLCPRIGPVTQKGEEDWVGRYVKMRRDWLSGLTDPLPSTVYRMDAFSNLIAAKNWDLALPVTVHGVTVAPETLISGEPPVPGSVARTLVMRSPYLRGDDVVALQRALDKNGLKNSCDGIYGPFTEVIVRKWQESKGIKEDGVGPDTRTSLAL